LVIHDRVGNQEKYYGRGGKTGDIEWTAFLADCEYEIETVTKGCRVSVSYGVYLKTFGPSGVDPVPLISPSDNFFDLMAPIMNMSRGKRLAFYLTQDYGVNPSEVLADSIVPSLKGGDSLLYHAFKMYKLSPELRWTAGGYVWPPDRIVEYHGEDIIKSVMPGRPFGVVNGSRMGMGVPPVRLSGYADPGMDHAEAIRSIVENSGGIPVEEAGITILTDWNNPAPLIGKERVPFVSAGELERLVVNVLLVVYIP
jgi:hypothetical protein